MDDLQRSAVIRPGPRFFERDGEIMFEHVIDSRTRQGPRLASDLDIANHPEAFARMGEPLDGVEVNPPPVGYIDPEELPEPAPKPYARRRDATLR